MKIPRVATVDFETEAIIKRPHYPPEPAGVAITKPGGKPRYYAFGHPTENNCTKDQAVRALQEVWESKDGVVFQHGNFDVDVATTHMGVPMLPWQKIHDTLFLLFLNNPHARSFGLKPSAEEILGMKPEERDELDAWIIRNVAGATKKTAGAFISKAPGTLVGRYACGDNTRTTALFEHLLPTIDERGMVASYDRERELMPILLANERAGVRADLPLLEHDAAMYHAALEFADDWLRKRLNVPDLNIDSDVDFANALESNGIVTEFKYTAPTKTYPEGKRSVSKKNLTLDMFNDAQVASVYGYRNRLVTCLSMFIDNWLNTARETGGWIHTSWNQVRQSKDIGNNFAGARTGRLSSSPNFQNIPKDMEGRTDGWVHPAFLAKFKVKFYVGAQKYAVPFPQLPLMRKYLLPDSGDHVWGHRDYSQQELRILAHYEDGELLQAYNDNPELDVHQIVKEGILQFATRDYERKMVKEFVFQRIYGGGLPAVCDKLRCDVVTAKKVLSAMDKALPGYHMLEKGVRELGRQGLSIRTWGGREYFAEPASFSKRFGRMMTYEYKLLNYLIQGSAADCTKQALINYANHPKRQARFLVTVHDEINCSMPRKRLKEEMKVLEECMRDVEFDLAMLSEGKVGENWGALTKYALS